MSVSDRDPPKLMASVPAWVMFAISVTTIVCSAGVTYGTTIWRVQDLERRVNDYEQFKADIRSDVSEMKTDLKWIRSAMEKPQR